MAQDTPPKTRPAPVRRYTVPEPGEDWPALVARVSKDLSGSAPESTPIDVAQLQSWNLHLVQRPPSVPLTPLDIVFLEPPRPRGEG
jgi:hypothetical protein